MENIPCISGTHGKVIINAMNHKIRNQCNPVFASLAVNNPYNIPLAVNMFTFQIPDFLGTQSAVKHQVKNTIVPDSLQRCPVKERIQFCDIIRIKYNLRL